MLAEKKNQNRGRREYSFSDAHFNFIRELVYETCGIKLSDIKRDMVYGRLARRLRSLKLDSFDEYCDIIRARPDDEMVEFTNAITTNLTSFFRENHHFEFLSEQALPQLSKTKQQRRLRLWSAGCSTGEEPYSLAITLQESLHLFAGWDVKILATDLDSNVVSTAKTGQYNLERIEGISQARISKWFKQDAGAGGNTVRMAQKLKQMITFKQLNLMHDWPMKGPFDIIFCRNVVIYFDKPTQRKLFDRYANYLTPNGYLIIGHSESLHGVSNRFRSLGKTIYSKIY